MYAGPKDLRKMLDLSFNAESDAYDTFHVLEKFVKLAKLTYKTDELKVGALEKLQSVKSRMWI